LSKASEKQARLNHLAVMQWVGPFNILKRFGVNYRIVSKGGKVMVVHHDQLKHSHIPFQVGKPVCPSREVPGG
jgi:uncharacterized cupin superfamily protein